MIATIASPTLIEPEGDKPKVIEEFFGKVNSATAHISIAKMSSPAGRQEPGQTPEFDEYTVVISGMLCVETHDETIEVNAGQAVIAPKGEWVRYSSPGEDGAEYMAVCLPAFGPRTVNRDE